MGQCKRVIGGVLGLVLVASFVLMPSAVVADEVTTILTEAVYIEYVCCDINENNDGTYLRLCNGYDEGVHDWRERALLKVPDQSGGGNITSVELKIYYYGYVTADAEGLPIRVYRCTRDFVEDEAGWYEYADGDDWTSAGGDYTSVNYEQEDCPAEDNWLVWNITDMAEDAWITDGEDLYVIVRFRYENEDNPSNTSYAFFWSDDQSETYRPRIVVAYAEAIQTPEVDGDVDEIGGTYVDYEITPTLYDWASANLTAQVAVHDSGNWSFESAVLTVTDNDPVIRTVTGLNKSTEYDIRAKLVYASGTVYSTNDTFTTLDYIVPTWSAGVDTVETNEIGFNLGWTDNNDNESITCRLAYRRQGLTEWNWEPWKDANNSTSKTWGENVDGLYEGRTYEYKAQFVITPEVYETAVQEVDTLDGVDLDCSISDQDVDFIQIKVDYVANNVSLFDLDARTRLVGGALWTDADTVEDLSGNGTQYFLFEGLRSMREYEYEVTASWDGDTATCDGTAWTTAIEITPVLTNLDAEFISPYTMRVSCDVVLNDADYLDPPIYCRYKPLAGSTWYTSNDETDVTDDGNWSVDVICGDELNWDAGYDFYMEIDYTSGTNQTAQDIFYTPAEPLAVLTVGVTGIDGDSAYFRGYAQLGEWAGLYGCFEYWVSGSVEDTYARSDYLWLIDSGAFEIQVNALSYGDTYVMQAFITETTAVGPALAYGGQYQFVAGFWGEAPADPDPDWGGLPWISYYDLWNWFANSTAGHWTIMIGLMLLFGLLFWRLNKHVAIIAVLAVLGAGIAIGWVDTWIVVLLALSAGFTIYRWVSGRASATGGL